MALTEAQMSIEIQGETYSLMEVPEENSKIVAEQMGRLLGAVDLKTLVEDLGRVGRFIRIAYNGIGAAGPKFTDLQIEVQRLGYDITKLCDKSAITVAKFKKTSGSILVDLQATYQYLLDNLEEMSVETLSAVSKLAGDMAIAADELHHDFEQQAGKVTLTLEMTMEKKGEEAERKQRMEIERKQAEIKRQEQEKLMQEAWEASQQAEADARRYEAKEDASIDEMASGGLNPLKNLVNGLTSALPVLKVGPIFRDTSAKAEGKADMYKQKKIEALKLKKEEQQKRKEALQKFTDFAAQIQNCKDEGELADAAVGALHQAIGGLKQLSVVMMQAALFWKQMQDHCKSLAESEMQKQVERALKYPEEKRLKVWTSRGFKLKAVEFYAGWVALHSVCTNYVEHIKLTRQDLYKYLQENPTYEESRQNVKQLAEAFLTDLKAAQQAITGKQFEAEKQIKALAAGSTSI